MSDQIDAPKVKAVPAGVNLLTRREFMTLLIGGGATMVLAATLAQPLDTFARDILQGRVDTPHGGDPNYQIGRAHV